nr:MAG TPA: YopX protein [Caudoviricetes sp.]DAQ05471.1 MAG TPA: YopX protein [Caudoviricetes sp.]
MKTENIKFKAKQLNSGKWFEGDLVRLGNRVCIGGDHIKDGITDVDPSTVCMFTGLKDCKGKEIFEHDLLQSQETKAIYEVVWNQGNTSFSLVNTECPVLYPNTLGGMLRNRRLKIVGNKFDEK